MTTLPNIYAQVVEHDPRLAVKDLTHLRTLTTGAEWLISWSKDIHGDDVARALIADHWTEMLPLDVMAVKSEAMKSAVWWVVRCDGEGGVSMEIGSCYPTRLEALAAFHLSQPKSKGATCG